MATTQYSGLFGDSYTAVDGKPPFRGRFRSIALRSGFRRYNALFLQLIGAGAGGTAAITHKQIAEDATGNTPGAPGGGLRTIETVTDINRVTTAGDIAELEAMTSTVYFLPRPYVVDLSGNGGPAFTGS